MPSQRLADWFTGPPGARLLVEEGPFLTEAARRFHGDTLLWVGCHGEVARTVRGCMIRNRLFASPVAAAAPDDFAAMRCSLEALPLPNSSLDAMVLHHALETAEDARRGLREAARVLVPGGRLLICAFNPLSLLGGRRAYAGLCQDAFSGLRFVTTFRLLDWLTLLGFERHTSVRYLSYGLSISGSREDAAAPGRFERFMRRAQAPFGGVYVISAVKQAVAVRPQWRPASLPASKLLPNAYPKSAEVLRFSDWKGFERSR